MKIKENTGVKVEFVHPEPGQGTEQFNLMLASGELPDIVEYNWSTFQGGPDKAIEDGYIYALNDIWEVWSPAISKIMKENPEWAKDTKSDGGNFYAYPFIREEDGMTVGTGLLIRHDWLKKLNSEVPETIDEWETVLTAFKEEFGCEKPLSMTADSLKNFMTAYNLWYGLYLDDGEVVYGEYQDTYRDYLAKMADWYAKGLIDPDIATVDSKAIDAGILSGQVGASAGWIGSSMGKWTTAARVAGDNEFLLAAAQFPVSKKGDKPEYGYKTRPVMMGVSAAATTNCSNVELAARLLDYGYTEEGHILFNFGIEGESFTWADKDGEKYPQYTDLILNNPDGLSITHAMGPYTRSNYNGIMIQDKRYLEQYYTQQEQVDALTLWAQVDMGKHVLPAVTILPEESDRYSEISANVSTYIEEMILKFVTGKEPIENFDKYKAQLKEFGIEEMIAMRQAAYERWKKR
jgi:putative aldouronate transport system substrate-binding protein